MTHLDFSNFITHLRGFIEGRFDLRKGDPFNELALELFNLQFIYNLPYRRYCQSQGVSPAGVSRWTQIPALPVQGFKELDLTSLPPEDRTFVFHSSGTTSQKPSRHFHSPDSLRIYEASLLAWFQGRVGRAVLSTPDSLAVGGSCAVLGTARPTNKTRMIFLTPSPVDAPHSSLVHMFETLRLNFGSVDLNPNLNPNLNPDLNSAFLGDVAALENREPLPLARQRFGVRQSPGALDGERAGVRGWCLDIPKTISVLQEATRTQQPLFLLGTAFNFVHLLDFMGEHSLGIPLPDNSWLLETGGYKGRSRILAKTDLHALITQRLGIPSSHIVSEYGMCELSSQAYAPSSAGWQPAVAPVANRPAQPPFFQFPPWARAQIVSPETGREVDEGGTGLIRVFDLANVYSVMAIQTEDFGVRRGDAFELLGRTALAEPRGCSLMSLA